MPAYTPVKGKACCGNCLFSRPSGVESRDIQCVRYPPQLVVYPAGGGLIERFPMLHRTDICGEWHLMSGGKVDREGNIS